MKKIARIALVVAAVALAAMSLQITSASAQDYTPNDPLVITAVYSPFKGTPPEVVDNAFGFGGKNPVAGSGAAAGGTTGGTTGAGGGLAHTGNDVSAPLAAAAVLIGGGGLIVLASRDRD